MDPRLAATQADTDAVLAAHQTVLDAFARALAPRLDLPDLWTAHQVFCAAQALALGPTSEGEQAAHRERLTSHAPALLAALDDGTITDRASLCAWWNPRVPTYRAAVVPEPWDPSDVAKMRRELGHGARLVPPVDRHDPEQWHFDALGDA